MIVDDDEDTIQKEQNKNAKNYFMPTIICGDTEYGEEAYKTSYEGPPVICEQGPSTPSSPTSSCESRLRKLHPLSMGAIERISMLEEQTYRMTRSNNFSLLSPYSTSDLGSSPRNSISTEASVHSSGWNIFRDRKKSSLEYDTDSDCCSKDLFSPCLTYSSSPFSPFSDCTDPPDTPYSAFAISPAISPNASLKPLHFSFDSVRCASALSAGIEDETHKSSTFLLPTLCLDSSTREKSCSDGEMITKRVAEVAEECATHSAISMLSAENRVISSSGQYKKRLLQKYNEEQEDLNKKCTIAASIAQANKDGFESQEPNSKLSSKEALYSQQKCCTEENYIEKETGVLPTKRSIGEPSLTSMQRVNRIETDLCLNGSRNLDDAFDSQQHINSWMQNQLIAIQSQWLPISSMVQQSSCHWNVPRPFFGTNFHHLLVPPVAQTCRTFLRTPSPKLEHSVGAVRQCASWRRSRSESDVSHENFVCHHCGQVFALHDRLTKHIASRHRDRSTSAVVEEASSKLHKCNMCEKSFNRSDMLTRHMRLHTGIKPYGCQKCGQVFSRSDHLSTHQRTHTGEKPYQCPHCNYAASRRDMITRHMRTHARQATSPEFNPLAMEQLNLGHADISLQSYVSRITLQPLAFNFPSQLNDSDLGTLVNNSSVHLLGGTKWTSANANSSATLSNMDETGAGTLDMADCSYSLCATPSSSSHITCQPEKLSTNGLS